jgi:protein-disulfide isomerase
MENGFICVNCGNTATEGSMQCPYCKKYFKKAFKNYDEYFKFLEFHDKI